MRLLILVCGFTLISGLSFSALAQDNGDIKPSDKSAPREHGVEDKAQAEDKPHSDCLLYTSPSPRDATLSRMPSSA